MNSLNQKNSSRVKATRQTTCHFIKTMPFGRRGLAAALFAVYFSSPGQGWSQSLPDAGRLLDETKNTGAPQPLHPLPDQPVLQTPERATLKMPEGLSVSVSGFRISGAVSFSDEELQALLLPWVAKTLDVNGLNEAAGAITQYYQSHGHFLTYAYLPAQKIADGVIELAVLEGKLENIEVATAQEVRLQDEVIQLHVADLSEGLAVSQPVMERRLLLLNDIPGVVARAAFTPGSAKGSADMVVSVAEDEPLAAQVELNNHGSRATGEYMLGASVHLKDLFGAGDSTRARLAASHTGNVVNGSLNTKVPFGGDGWTLGAGISRLSYQLGSSYSALGGIGQATVFNVNVAYPLIRSFASNLNVQTSFDHKKLRDEIQLTALINPKDSNILGLGLNYDQRDQWLGAGSLTAAVNLNIGRLSLNDTTQFANDKAGLKTAGQYSKLNFDLTRQQSLFDAWSLYGRLTGQQALKNLDSTEKLALTGPSGVRAYAVGEATVDKGRFVNLELRYTQAYVGGALVWSVFHDQGWGRFNTNPLAGVTGNDIHLYGSGLGLQWMDGDQMGMNTTLSWHGKRPPATAGKNTNPTIFTQLYYNL